MIGMSREQHPGEDRATLRISSIVQNVFRHDTASVPRRYIRPLSSSLERYHVRLEIGISTPAVALHILYASSRCAFLLSGKRVFVR